MDLKRSSKLPAAIGVAAVLLGVFLIGMLGMAYWLVNRSSITLIHGQAGSFMADASRGFRSLGRPPRDVDARRFLESRRAEGLRYLALWRPEMGITAAAGDTPTSIDNATLSALRVEAPQFLGDRVRIKLGPPDDGLRHEGEGRRPAPPPWENGAGEPSPWGRPPSGEPAAGPPDPGPPDAPQPRAGVRRPPLPGQPPYVIMEFEPLAAQRLRHLAQLNLLVGLGIVAAIIGGAFFLIRLLRRQQDLTERVEHARRLAALGEMAAVIAHEIRNPLTALKGHAQLLLRALGGDARQEKAGRVVNEAVRLETLLSDLLEFARTGTVEVQSVDPARVLQESAEAVAAERIITHDAEAPHEWSMDPARMQRVLTNVLRNAVQMSPDGAAVEASVYRDNAHLVFEVRDHGPGIPAGEEEKIFEPFYTRQVRGTGLGLSLAQRIVGQHRGVISARNHPDGGAVFRIAVENL